VSVHPHRRAVEVSFAMLPVCVTQIVLRLPVATPTQLDEALAAVEESARVPAALWHEALSAGLLSPELSLPAAAPLN
jgi:hypothetical protein